MENNTCRVYNDITEVYDKLIEYCYSKGFVVKESKEKYYYLKAKKISLLFWHTIRMEMRILAVGKQMVEVAFEVYKGGKRQSSLETECVKEFNKFI